ncbi:hypothetical protein CHCC20335_0736 [Bacillus paralicheniformis]|nr:hypothetical protein CHCC20335_0736 [Bacillus paralicheniformis]
MGFEHSYEINILLFLILSITVNDFHSLENSIVPLYGTNGMFFRKI